MKARSLLVLISVLSILVAASCSKPSSGSSSTGNSTGKSFKLAFVTNNASDYWTIARKGVEKADAEL
ncbi:MAG: hypothetical protein ABI878_07855, partial [Acidobacteriota bacterium]